MNGFSVLSNRESIMSFTERWADSNAPVRIDCRQVKDHQLLLKFIEDYRGDIEMIVLEPVPSTILSRFSDIRKVYNPPASGSIWGKFLDRVPAHLKEKVGSVIGIKYDNH